MQRADLPPELQRRVLADLDPPARLALFASSPPLARTVLLNTPSGKRLTKLDSSAWPPALASLLDDPSLLTLADMELCAKGSGAPQPPPPPPVPPLSIARHVTRLQLHSFTLTPSSLAAWRLHDATLWPHLQHLAIQACTLPPSPAPAQPLRPIPRLLTFAWEEPERGGVPNDAASLAAVLRLASQAKQLLAVCRDRDRSRPWTMAPQALASLPHLTHADLDVSGTPEVVEALLRHRTLEHVTLDCLARPQDQWAWRRLSHLPCRWRTLTAARGASMLALSGLPLAHLERLTVCGQLGAGGAYGPLFGGHDDIQAGLAVLQRLHSQGRLALRKSAAQDLHWRQPPEEGLFALQDLGSLEVPAALRLVMEAGQGITAILVDAYTLLESEGDLAPLQARHTGIVTLCVQLEAHEKLDVWWGAAFRNLPERITHLKVDVSHFGHDPHGDGPYDDAMAQDFLRDLVVGSDADPLTRPLTLTLLHSGLIGPELEAELMGLCVSGAAGQGEGAVAEEGEEPLQPFVTLRVVRTDQEEA